MIVYNFECLTQGIYSFFLNICQLLPMCFFLCGSGWILAWGRLGRFLQTILLWPFKFPLLPLRILGKVALTFPVLCFVFGDFGGWGVERGFNYSICCFIF